MWGPHIPSFSTLHRYVLCMAVTEGKIANRNMQVLSQASTNILLVKESHMAWPGVRVGGHSKATFPRV